MSTTDQLPIRANRTARHNDTDGPTQRLSAPAATTQPGAPPMAQPHRDMGGNASIPDPAPQLRTDSPAQTHPQPRARVLTMPEYHPPLAERSALRLDFNENTFGPSPRVAERLRALTPEGLTIYPERQHVERIVAEHVALTADQVLLTNGVDEAIHLLCCAFLDEGDEALVATPSFFIYDVSVSMMTSALVRIQSDDSLAFPYDRFLSAITPRTKLIFIASPNNPTGAVVSREHIFEIAARAPHAVVFVDEAYFHFFGETVLPDLAAHPNIIVGRTFSKAYGLASLRIGMLAGAPTLMQYLRKVSSPYNVNGVALDLLPAALSDETYLDWYINEVHTGRERIIDTLRDLHVPFWPSAANFVLFRIGPAHADFVRRMRTHGVLVRDRSTDPGCQGCVRITVGVQDHVTRGLTALRTTLEEMQWRP